MAVTVFRDTRLHAGTRGLADCISEGCLFVCEPFFTPDYELLLQMRARFAAACAATSRHG